MVGSEAQGAEVLVRVMVCNGQLRCVCLQGRMCGCVLCKEHVYFRHIAGHGGFSGEGSCQSHWYLQLHHHQDREHIEDSQDCPGCEPGGVSSLFPATQAEGIL